MNLQTLTANLSGKHNDHRGMFICPFHQEDTPSLSVNFDKQVWYCFGCKRKGDALDFLSYVHYDQPASQLGHRFKDLLAIAGEEVTLPTLPDEPEPEPTWIDDIDYDRVLLWHEQLLKTPDALDYLYGRGISWEIINHWRLGWTGDFAPQYFRQMVVIPYWHNFFTTRAFKFRSIAEKKYLMKRQINDQKQPFGWFHVVSGVYWQPVLMIVESELDALLVNSLLQRPHIDDPTIPAGAIKLAIAAPTEQLKPDFIQELNRRGHYVYLIRDMDDPGLHYADWLLDQMPNLQVMDIPHESKDIGEWWQVEPEAVTEWVYKLYCHAILQLTMTTNRIKIVS